MLEWLAPIAEEAKCCLAYRLSSLGHLSLPDVTEASQRVGRVAFFSHKATQVYNFCRKLQLVCFGSKLQSSEAIWQITNFVVKKKKRK